MAVVQLSDRLIHRLQKQAEKANLSLEAWLEKSLSTPVLPEGWDEGDAILIAQGILEAPDTELLTPPLTDAEALVLAERLGAAGSISALIIQERQEGY